jgi:hypothetical protein
MLPAVDVRAALVARAEVDPSFPPVPAIRTVRRYLLRLRADPVPAPEAQPASDRPADQPSAEDLPDQISDDSPIAALRSLLREALDELQDAPRRSSSRFRLRQQAVALAATLARTGNLGGATSAEKLDIIRQLDRFSEELLDASAQPRSAAPTTVERGRKAHVILSGAKDPPSGVSHSPSDSPPNPAIEPPIPATDCETPADSPRSSVLAATSPESAS